MPDATICYFVRPGSLKAAKLFFHVVTSMNIKNVEPVLLPVPQCKGLRIARLVETNNAESPTQNVYKNSRCATHSDTLNAIRIHYRLSINIPRGAPVALFLTNRSKLRSSYTVKTKASENAYVHDVCTAAFFAPPIDFPTLAAATMHLQRYE